MIIQVSSLWSLVIRNLAQIKTHKDYSVVWSVALDKTREEELR